MAVSNSTGSLRAVFRARGPVISDSPTTGRRPRSRRLHPSRPPRSRRSVRLALAVVAALLGLLSVVGPASAEEYVVQPGDSLSVIARDHGVSTDELAAANAISDLHLIRVGQTLRIPRAEPVTYVVQPGDSLGLIALQAGVSPQAIIDQNGITDANLIRVGQVLEIPDGGTIIEAVDPAAGYNSLPSRLTANPERLELIPLFEQWADHYSVPRDLLMAMAYRESGWQNDVVSSKGAVGIGQLMPTTSAWLANDLIKADLDPRVPSDNIRMSARMLQWLIGFMGGETQAVAAYYQGPGSVNARGFYDDTQEYVDNVNQIRSLFVKS